jgi:hypothetical protein
MLVEVPLPIMLGKPQLRDFKNREIRLGTTSSSMVCSSLEDPALAMRNTEH